MAKTNKLFKHVNNDAVDHWEGNTYAFILENPIEATPWFAAGFHRAGREYVKVIRTNSGNHPDTDILPVVFLYRHAVELALKGLVWNGDEVAQMSNRPLSKSKGPQGDGHDLAPLLTHATHVIKTLKLPMELVSCRLEWSHGINHGVQCC